MCNRFYMTYIFADNHQVPPDVSGNSGLHQNTREDLASPSCSSWNQNTGRGFTGVNRNHSRDADVDLSRNDEQQSPNLNSRSPSVSEGIFPYRMTGVFLKLFTANVMLWCHRGKSRGSFFNGYDA